LAYKMYFQLYIGLVLLLSKIFMNNDICSSYAYFCKVDKAHTIHFVLKTEAYELYAEKHSNVMIFGTYIQV